MPFAIRPARYEDAAAIARVQVESWKTTYVGIVPAAFLETFDEAQRTPKWQELLTASNHNLFVAGEPCITAFIGGGPLRKDALPEGIPLSTIEPYDAELYTLYLLASAQRQGLGRALLQTLAAVLHDQGLQSLTVQVLAQNPAVAFYKHLGAIEIARYTTPIGGADLPDLLLAWPSLEPLVGS